MTEYEDAYEVCDDCGRQFPRSELRRCKICGHYVCPECRSTHIARYHRTPEEPVSVPPQEEPAPVQQQEIPQTPVQPAYHHVAPKPKIEETVRCAGCGREFPKSRMKKCNICGEYLCLTCSETHLSKKHGWFLYSEPEQPVNQTPVQAYTEPVQQPPVRSYTESELHTPVQEFMEPTYTPEPEQPVIHFREELSENPIGQAASYYENEPVDLYASEESVQEDYSERSDGKIRCDDCGEYFEKSELRVCKKCGHNVCPNCRPHHKCPKPSKQPKQPKQHFKIGRKHDELGDPVY
ncbi:MAG TPA: hypothetical protein O0W79_03585 [Methanocorpusculum sp.]|nr:hypothetical protein [Methanocorpusculum sp.]